MAVLFDISARTIVVHCTRCRHWTDIVLGVEAAQRIALEHTWAVHPDDERTVGRIHAQRHRARVARESA